MRCARTAILLVVLTWTAGSVGHVVHEPCVSARLPVAACHIVGRSLYGKWRAEVFLDGNEKSCTRRPKKFRLDP